MGRRTKKSPPCTKFVTTNSCNGRILLYLPKHSMHGVRAYGKRFVTKIIDVDVDHPTWVCDELPCVYWCRHRFTLKWLAYAIPRSAARHLNGAEFARYARNAQRFFIGSHKSVSPVVSVVKTIMALYTTEQVAEMFDNSDIDAESESEVEEDPAFPLPAVE